MGTQELTVTVLPTSYDSALLRRGKKIYPTLYAWKTYHLKVSYATMILRHRHVPLHLQHMTHRHPKPVRYNQFVASKSTGQGRVNSLPQGNLGNEGGARDVSFGSPLQTNPIREIHPAIFRSHACPFLLNPVGLWWRPALGPLPASSR